MKRTFVAYACVVVILALIAWAVFGSMNTSHETPVAETECVYVADTVSVVDSNTYVVDSVAFTDTVR